MEPNPFRSDVPGGLNVWGEVTGANTATNYASNATAAAIDLASATYTVTVHRE